MKKIYMEEKEKHAGEEFKGNNTINGVGKHVSGCTHLGFA